MYVNKKYQAGYYALLSVAERMTAGLDFELKNYQTEEKKKFLIKIGMRKILAAGRWRDFNNCDYLQIGEAAMKAREEVRKYLDKFREQYEQDKAAGKLENICVGEQEEFEFTDTIKVGDLTIPHYVSRDEIVRYHRTRGNKT